FCAPILAHAALMQGITTSTRGRIVKGFSQVITTQEPFEAASRRSLPVFVMRESKSLETSGDDGIGFKRLLIEPRTFGTALPKTIATNRREMSGIRFLRFDQPAERLQTRLEDLATRSPMTT